MKLKKSPFLQKKASWYDIFSSAIIFLKGKIILRWVHSLKLGSIELGCAIPTQPNFFIFILMSSVYIFSFRKLLYDANNLVFDQVFCCLPRMCFCRGLKILWQCLHPYLTKTPPF